MFTIPLRIAVSAAVLAAVTALAPATALAAEVLRDLDARSGSVQPTTQQQQIVSGLKATATWNDFGTPGSLIKHGGFLATDLSGPEAGTVARSWVDSNKALFRLSSAQGLELRSATRLPESNGYAVLFEQRFGGFRPAEDGLLTVGVVGTAAGGWKVAYASSSITGDTALSGAKSLSPQQAWLEAAADVGHAASILELRGAKAVGDWTVFGANAIADPQRARLRALPTPTNGVRLVYETLFLDNPGGLSRAYQHYIDAQTGAVLVRKDLVEHSHPPADQFSGSVPSVDGACAPDNGPWVIDPSESVGSIVVSIEAHVPANDVVVHLLRNGAIVASQDTVTSPEVLAYTPAGGVPAGTYTVRVCDFGDGAPWTPPPTNTYAGQIVFNPVAAGGGLPYPPQWKVFKANPLLGNQAYPWNNPSTDIRETWCWESTTGPPPGTPVPGCQRQVQNLASRVPWDYNVRSNTPTFTTVGNNANTGEAWASPLTPGPSGFRPVQPDRKYIYPWTNQWHTSQCLPAFASGVTQDISAAVTNLFAMHNRMHDWSYFLGFTERNWNAQDSNFGNNSPGTSEGDPLFGDAQAGAATGGFPSYLGRDNANMVALPDGVPPITNMYLWQPLAGSFYAPCADGDYDMAVIGHEFGHLTENRMIGKGGTRGGHHAGAMGESFGDLNAAEYLNEFNFVPVSGENPFAVGAYATGNKQRAIRNYGMNFPRTGAFPTPGVSPQINPLNFSDHGYDITGAQVHADGEIWSATNYDIRQALVAKYNGAYPATNALLQRQCADGQRTPDTCPGNRRWIQLVFDAMLLMPTAPSMLEARDAYLAADLMRTASSVNWPSNQNELWLTFARRGFGQFASSTNALSDQNDTDPKPNFESANQGETNVTFNTVGSNEGNAPVKARIFVGHYEARVSPIADTDPATTTTGENNLDNVARFVAGTYEFLAQANGYGFVRFTQTFSGSGSQTVTINMPTNRASTSKGATATGAGSNHVHLIDDTEQTNWDEPAGGLAVNVQQPQVTVDLQGTAPVTVNRVQVSAMLEPGQNRFTALRQFRIERSTNGVTFTPVLTSAGNAFPGFNPRPVAPEIILRSFSFSGVPATHIRITILQNQCTGNTAFQGEQDADPLNSTDCRFGNPGSDPVGVFGDLPDVLAERASEVHVAELQVFSSGGGTGGGGGGGGGGNPPPPPPGDDECDDDDDLVKLGPPVAAPGDTVEYTISVTNHGDVDDDCEIDDLLPDDLTYVSSSGAGVYDAATRTVTWDTGTIAPGATRVLTLTARVSSSATIGSTLINRANFGALGVDASPPAAATTLVLP
jgi:extracellular elastinolytic metalloproteinase